VLVVEPVVVVVVAAAVVVVAALAVEPAVGLAAAVELLQPRPQLPRVVADDAG